jgi:RecA/RadA recombinase
MSNFLEDLATELGSQYASIASKGESAAEIAGYIDTGCYLLNAIISGSIFKGLASNKITAIAGEEATGKTFIALGICKYHLESNPDARVIYFDTEAAITKDMLEERGIDTKRFMIVAPGTIQEFRTLALKIVSNYEKLPVKKRPPTLCVLDSLGMLSTTKEVDDTAEGKETRDMTKSQVLKAAFRVLTLRLAKANLPLLVTNHVYDVIGSYVPMQEMGGGSGLKYAASSIIFLSKSKDKIGTEVVGNLLKVKMNKSRLTKENAVVVLKLSYASGLDRYYGLLDLAVKHGIITKLNNISYELPGGVKVKGAEIRNHPEQYFTPELLTLVDEAAKKEFCYGKNDGRNDGELDTESEVDED